MPPKKINTNKSAPKRSSNTPPQVPAPKKASTTPPAEGLKSLNAERQKAYLRYTQPLIFSVAGIFSEMKGTTKHMLQRCADAYALTPNIRDPPKKEQEKKEASPSPKKKTPPAKDQDKKKAQSPRPNRALETPKKAENKDDDSASTKRGTSPPAQPRWKVQPKERKEKKAKVATSSSDAQHKMPLGPMTQALLSVAASSSDVNHYPLIKALPGATPPVAAPSPKPSNSNSTTNDPNKPQKNANSCPPSPVPNSKQNHHPSTGVKRLNPAEIQQSPRSHSSPNSPSNPRKHSPISTGVTESQRRVLDQQKRTLEMRAERRKREEERLAREMEIARAQAVLMRRREEDERAAKERALEERLDALRAKRENRELDYLVGQRRAHQVLQSKSLADVMAERYAEEQRAEEEKRAEELRLRREKLRGPVVVGVEEAQKRLEEVQERKRRRDAELKANWDELARQVPKHHHGTSYERATEQHTRLKHQHEDLKHNQLYKHAKMQEYGNLVKRLQAANSTGTAWDDMDSEDEDAYESDGRRKVHHVKPIKVQAAKHSAPFNANTSSGAHHVLSHVEVKQSLPPAERNKAGNNFLREAMENKAPLPPGLKLTPIEDIKRENEYKRFKDRKVKGDQYLRDIRQQPHAKPSAEQIDDEKYLDEIRKLRSKASHMENRLLEHQATFADPEECVEQNEQYLEVIKAKMELLQRMK